MVPSLTDSKSKKENDGNYWHKRNKSPFLSRWCWVHRSEIDLKLNISDRPFSGALSHHQWPISILLCQCHSHRWHKPTSFLLDCSKPIPLLKITKLSKCEQISGVINTTTFTVKWNLTDSQVATINLIVSRLTVLCLSCPIPMQGSGNNSQTGYLAQVCLWNRYQYRYRNFGMENLENV